MSNPLDPAEVTVDLPAPEPADPAPLTRLVGWDLDLAPPASLAERWDVVGAAGDAPDNQVMVRVLAAALGLCWGRFRRNAKAPKYDGRILAYGGRVLDYLLGAGADLADIVTAGLRAQKLCQENALASEDVEAAEGFSRAR
jgi:hypothetical protein